MKKEADPPKKPKSHDIDKKDLVNLDFYDNEIMVMQQKLNEVSANADDEVKKKVQHLKHLLNHQKHILDEFRKNFDVEEMVFRNKLKLSDQKLKNKDETNAIKNDENFFQHLHSFESAFKDIREEVQDLYKTGNKI